LAALFRSDLDWDAILDAAERHRLAPLVYHSLRSLGEHGGVPATAMERLRRLYYWQAARNAHFHGELRRIVGAFSQAGVSAIVLKGAAIAELVYENIALRPMQDLDLLVRKADLNTADRIVRGLGYAPNQSYRSAEWYREHHHHLAPYASAQTQAVVEVHHDVLPPSAAVRPSLDELWRHARSVRIASVRTLVLAPEHLLVHLCLDVSCVDAFVGRLLTLCDISAAIERYENEIDWIRLLSTVRDQDAERFVYYPLWLARRMVGARVPETVLQQLQASMRGPGLEDFLLRILAQRAVLADRHDALPIPARVLASRCGRLLGARGAWGAIRALQVIDLLAGLTGRLTGRPVEH
jgi:hypothetical protein